METGDTSPLKKMKARIPPKRGSIKAKIFGILAKKVTGAASVAGLGKKKEGGTGSSGWSRWTNPPCAGASNGKSQICDQDDDA